MIDVPRRAAGAATYLAPLDDIAISVTTAHELAVGARNQCDAADIDGLIKTYSLLADLAARITGRAYQLLKRHAKPAGLRTFDASIAATAIEDGFTLVSKNRKHFRMIGDLKLEVPTY
jgi:predicted nucleic acid-binding protein